VKRSADFIDSKPGMVGDDAKETIVHQDFFKGKIWYVCLPYCYNCYLQTLVTTFENSRNKVHVLRIMTSSGLNFYD
jgi:hypothetical protein